MFCSSQNATFLTHQCLNDCISNSITPFLVATAVVFRLDTYFQYFMPFIVTALLPTAISSQWRKIDSHRLTRDEQTWLSTTYVQIYAFLQVFTHRAKEQMLGIEEQSTCKSFFYSFYHFQMALGEKMCPTYCYTYGGVFVEMSPSVSSSLTPDIWHKRLLFTTWRVSVVVCVCFVPRRSPGHPPSLRNFGSSKVNSHMHKTNSRWIHFICWKKLCACADLI